MTKIISSQSLKWTRHVLPGLIGSVSSPIHRRKKITWRNDSDIMNALSKGNSGKMKDAKNMRAHEAANLNYGERDGQNVMNNSEYQRNLIAMRLFHRWYVVVSNSFRIDNWLKTLNIFMLFRYLLRLNDFIFLLS